MLAGLLPEDELCLLLARGQLQPEVRARALELLAAPIRWTPLLQRAEQHRVTPLLYRSLKELEFQSVPVEAKSALTATFRANALRNLFLTREVARVLGTLSEAGIRVIPLKGVALASLLYGDPAFRSCTDIDILVPASAALSARRVLQASGYASPFTDEFFISHQFHTTADCPLFPQKPIVPYLLELHWTLVPHAHKDAEAVQDLWLQARPRDYFGVQAASMSPEWEFLFLAIHVATHEWQTLRWIADINDLCASASIDWEKVREMAGLFELNFVVESTLAVCAWLYGTPMPGNFASAELPKGVPLFPHSLDSAEAWKAPLFSSKLLARPTDKLKWLAEMFFVARVADRRFVDLPDSFSFLYYGLRPLRLTFKWSWLFIAAGIRRLGEWLGSASK
jgi:hypothetical protein